MTVDQSVHDRFAPKFAVNERTGCWEWTAGLNGNGYGTFGVRRETGPRAGSWAMRLAHRVAYEIYRGPIDEGRILDHLCRVKRCVNPVHLEMVDHRENTRRGVAAAPELWGAHERRRVECPRGHRYEGANLIISPRGSRLCRECRRARSRGAYRRRQERALRR